MRSQRRWAERLLETARAGESILPSLVAAFAEHYVELSDHADRLTESTARMIEERAASCRQRENSQRGAPSAHQALSALAADVRAHLHITGEAAARPVHLHDEGGMYEFVCTCAVKNDENGEWEEGIAYRPIDGEHAGLLCVTSLQRWDARFQPIADPDL